MTNDVQRIEGYDGWEPAVSGDRIVFRSGQSRDDQRDAGIYMFDRTSGSVTQVSRTVESRRGGPDIRGDFIVWWDRRRGDRDIFGYNLASQMEFQVSVEDDDQDEPAVSGGSPTVVVWTDRRRGNANLQGARLTVAGASAPTATPTIAPPSRPIGPAPTPSPASVPRDDRYFTNTGFRISTDAFWEYYNLRGGSKSFGYPISREFTFMGFTVQFFQGHIMQLFPNGQVVSMNLLQEGLMPATKVNGSTFPSSDPELTGSAPRPGTSDYAEQVVEFTRKNAPSEFNGQPVGFLGTFLNTVDLATAFPNGGGDPNLLPLLNLEIWGVPTSKPQADPANSGFIYQRFQRSIMHYQQSCRCTERILLADWFRTVITGDNLPADLAADMANSPFIRQYDNSMPSGLARPDALPNTDMSFAFEPQ